MASNNEITYLGSGFSPSELDVIVGRGKVCYKHSGNLRLARIVQSVLGTYSSAEATKKSKTELIKSLVTQVRESTPDGGFVKFDSEKGEWFEVGDRTAREKVSQAFRDALTDVYKSSSTSKTLKRRQERITRQISVDSGSNVGSNGEPLTPGGSLYADPNSLPFGKLSLASQSPRPPLASPLPRRSMGLHIPSPSPRASMTLGRASPRAIPRMPGATSPRNIPRMPGATLGLSMASPGATHVGMSNLVSPLSGPAAFSTSPGGRQFRQFGAASASPSPLAMSLAAQNAQLGAMAGESPSSIRLAVAIAERKRRLNNLNMIMAARGNAGGRSMGGFGRPQVPHTL